MTSLTKTEISALLDIGPDFLFVDSFVYTVPELESRTTYKFDERHKYIKHHFLKEVVIPGALVLESMLQSMALTIYCTKSWKGIALISSINSQFIEPLQLDSNVENTSIIRVNSGGRVEGEMICTSNGNTISRVSCIFYSDYVFSSKNNSRKNGNR
jgi:3-hydroxymyristoyl/3-hydroxydecanoyl-(acyl carrier protein) dehydratase